MRSWRVAFAVIVGWSCSSNTPGNPDGGGDAAMDSTSDVGVPDAAAEASADAGLRTLTGAYTVTYEKDDHTQTVKSVSGPAGVTFAALVAKAGGYTSYPGTLASDGTLVIPNVPAGRYFLVRTTNGYTSIADASADVISLNSLRAARPDIATVTQSTLVTFQITNLAPWVKNGSFDILSSQGGVDLRPFQYGGVVQPAAGATTASPVVDWNKGAVGTWAAGLPDANKGDIVYVALGNRMSAGTGAATATVRRMTEYAALTDLTVVDGVPKTENVSLAAAAQTGSVPIDVRFTQFAALTADVNPAAQPSSFGASVFAQPYSLVFPNFPTGNGSGQLLQLALDVSAGTASADAGAPDGGASFADFDYGTFAYGQFLDSNWKEFSSISFMFNVSFTAQGATPSSWGNVSLSSTRATVASVPLVPLLSPPKAPRINGQDAFTNTTGVTLTPTLSWSPPALGTPTSYAILIVKVENVSNATVLTPVADAYLFGTSLQLPPGALTSGVTYFAVITANAAPWDVLDEVSGYGTPIDTADCVTGTFTP